MAPSTSARGGLQPSQTPQFVLISHDDAIKVNTHTMMRAISDGKSAGGCPVVATMFVTRPHTANDCELTLDLYTSGWEIAHHTVGHQVRAGWPAGWLPAGVLAAAAALAPTHAATTTASCQPLMCAPDLVAATPFATGPG